MNIISYLNGCCEFRACGYFPERFINLAARADAGLWDIRRVDDGIFAKITARRYKRLLPLARKCGIKLHITKKYGLPFKLMPYRKRAGMPLGFLLFCGIIWLLSQFYWIVEIPQVSSNVQPKLEQAIYEAGIRPGVLRSHVDAEMISKELQIELDELSWVGISTSGSYISIDAREMRQIDLSAASDTPCNIVAARDGIILSVKAAEGQPAVSVGQSVAKGDLLISGVMEYANGDISMVHSQGEVFANTFYRFTSEVSCDQHMTERTGRVITIRRIMLFGIEIPLYIGKLPEGQFEREHDEWQLSVSGTSFPLIVRTERWYELKTINRIISIVEAEEIARSSLEKQAEALKDAEIISCSESLEHTDNGVSAEATYTVRENIALTEVILFE